MEYNLTKFPFYPVHFWYRYRPVPGFDTRYSPVPEKSIPGTGTKIIGTQWYRSVPVLGSATLIFTIYYIYSEVYQ